MIKLPESLRALRVHQWVKNLLLFVPLIMSHSFLDKKNVIFAFLGFLAFSFVASAGYLINDIKDLESDKEHPKKSKRPLASGKLSISSAIIIIFLLLGLALFLSTFLPKVFFIILSVYFFLTISYSLFFKKLLVLDIIFLASLYAVRILAGGMATALEVTPWLLAFSVFMFFSLACIKRYSELIQLYKRDLKETPGRAYTTDDIQTISIFGISSGFIAVLVLALYINGGHVATLYSKPEALWLICPAILYWVSRVWILASRGEVDEDPIIFALKDKTSYVTALVALILIYIAI